MGSSGDQPEEETGKAGVNPALSRSCERVATFGLSVVRTPADFHLSHLARTRTSQCFNA